MTRPLRIGLTGSIGMGKSTTAAMFASLGVPVWDADAAVHRLYAPGGAAVAPIAALWPDAVRDGAVDRAALRQVIAADPGALKRIEAVVHPLVAADRARFAAQTPGDLLLFDLPLLFENGAEAEMDSVVVVTAPPEVQRARVLARPGMTEADFQRLLAQQVPDDVKRARADHVIETQSLEQTRAAVRQVLDRIRKDHGLA